MSAPASRMRELVALAGPVQCDQPDGAVNLVLRGHLAAPSAAVQGTVPGAPPDASAGLTEVLFSDATPVTLPMWSYFSSLIITLLIPSAGGHWAVQGPFVLPAALSLHASLPRTAMGVAMAENVSNMLQPFWAAPVVAMAGVGVQRVLGFTVMTFLLGAVVYGAALLLLI